MRVAALVVLFAALSAADAAAQDIGGYVTAGTGSIDYLVHRETIPQFAGGVLWRIADDRIRVGAEVNAMTSNRYWSGRGGPVAEVVLIRRERFSPFIRGGRFFGEDTSWVAGAGVDLWLGDRTGLRLMVQDAFRQSVVRSFFDNRRTVFHEPSLQIGWTW
jgi:hypothetical protein